MKSNEIEEENQKWISVTINENSLVLFPNYI